MFHFIKYLLFQKNNKDADFYSHLSDLRKRIIISLIFLIAFSILIFFYIPLFFDEVLMSLINENFITFRAFRYLSHKLPFMDFEINEGSNFTLINTDVGGQFRYHLILSFVIGFICAFPFILHQFWLFIKPSLYPDELKIARKFIYVMLVLFLLGSAFGYFIICPLTIKFLLSYELSPYIKNMITVSSLVSMVSILTLSMGLVFEIPVLIFFLTKIRILNSGFLRQYRKLAIVIIFIIAGFITPSTDVFSQLLVGIPILLLYELSILISMQVEKRNKS